MGKILRGSIKKNFFVILILILRFFPFVLWTKKFFMLTYFSNLKK